MIRVLTPIPRWLTGRTSGLSAVLAIAIAVAACGGKSEGQLADDALNAGIAAHNVNNIAEAQKQYNECLKHEVTHKVCHYNLGLIAQTSGDAVTAENEYRLSLSTDPNYTPAIFNLAILRNALGDTAQAITLNQKYIQLLPNDASGHLNLGLLLIATGDEANGKKEIAAAVALDPTISVPQTSSAPSSTPRATPSLAPSPS